MKSILISIQPKWVEKILNGEKTIEIRKTMPKCELPCKVYIYCTKDKDNLLYGNSYINRSWELWKDKTLIKDKTLVKGWDAKTGEVFDCCLANGKVIAEFTLDKITKHEKNYIDAVGDGVYYNFSVEHLKKAGFVNSEMKDWGKVFRDFDSFINNYGKGKPLYAWYIDDLKIYDRPKELSKFKKANWQQLINKLEYIGCDELYCNAQINVTMSLDDGECDYNCCPKLKITRPPQSWCYVEEI